MGVKLKNNAFGTLSAGISSSATTITLDSGQGLSFLLPVRMIIFMQLLLIVLIMLK